MSDSKEKAQGQEAKQPTLRDAGSELSEPTRELREQFDRLTALKMEKWDAIKDKVLYRDTPEWQDIEDIDAQLWAIKRKMEGN